MLSHGIKIVIHQNVCLDVYVSEMVPAIFFFYHVSRSRTKVKGQRFRIQWANDYVIIYG